MKNDSAFWDYWDQAVPWFAIGAITGILFTALVLG